MGRNLVARPTKQPTDDQRKQVQTLSGYGLTQEQIASFLGIHWQTLTKWCKEELANGKNAAYIQAVQGLFTNIRKGKEASIFFYLKTQHNWREKAQLELSGGVDTGPAILQVVKKPK